MQDWNFRKPIIVEQSGVAQITVPFEKGMNADFSDVRFVAADEETLLDYTRLSYNEGQDAVFAVDAVSPNMYAYFGNEEAEYESTWEPEAEVIQSFTHEQGLTKYSGNPVLEKGTSPDWDSYLLYAPVFYDVGGVTHMLYAGGDGSGSEPRHTTSIGLATSTDGVNFTKQGIVFDKSGVSGVGVAPFSLIEISGTYYLFVSMFTNDSTAFNIGYLTSTDLTTWGGYTALTGTASSAHGPYVMEDPTDASGLIIYYSGSLSTSGHVRTAKASKSDPSVWSDDTAVLGGVTLYPFCEFADGIYNLYYGRQLSNGQYRLFKSQSRDGVNFLGEIQALPLGGSSDWDGNYMTGARIYDGKLFYAGRKLGVNRYEAIGFAEFDNTGGILEWSAVSGNVSADATYARNGTYGVKMVGDSTTPPNIRALANGRDKVYEVWIYDDLTMTSDFQNTFRLLDSATIPELLVGIYTVTSTSKYIYRKKGGTWAQTTINRTAGWHKLTFEVGDNVKVYIDDVLVATDTAFNTDDLQAVGMYGYKAGVGYFDDYKVHGLEFVEVQVGSEINPN